MSSDNHNEFILNNEKTKLIITGNDGDISLDINNFPITLVHLELKHMDDFNTHIPTNILKNLEYLKIGSYKFNQNLDDLSKSMTHLILPGYRGTITKFPPNLQCLNLGFYKGKIPDIPNSVTKLTLLNNKDNDVKFPKNLTYLKIDKNCKTFDIPKTLEKLVIVSCYERSGDDLIFYKKCKNITYENFNPRNFLKKYFKDDLQYNEGYCGPDGEDGYDGDDGTYGDDTLNGFKVKIKIINQNNNDLSESWLLESDDDSDVEFFSNSDYDY